MRSEVRVRYLDLTGNSEEDDILLEEFLNNPNSGEIIYYKKSRGFGCLNVIRALSHLFRGK